MKKANSIKKTISAVLSAVTLSPCVAFPTSVSQLSGKMSLINPIVADASILPCVYNVYHRIGTVNAQVAKMYWYDLKAKKFKAYSEANVLKDTPVQILGETGEYYLVSEANDGMWMKKKDIKENKKNIVCKVVQPVTFAACYSCGGGAPLKGSPGDPNSGKGVGNLHPYFTIYRDAVLELNPEGKCVRYYGYSNFYYDKIKYTPVGSDFFYQIGVGLKITNYI